MGNRKEGSQLSFINERFTAKLKLSPAVDLLRNFVQLFHQGRQTPNSIPIAINWLRGIPGAITPCQAPFQGQKLSP